MKIKKIDNPETSNTVQEMNIDLSQDVNSVTLVITININGTREWGSSNPTPTEATHRATPSAHTVRKKTPAPPVDIPSIRTEILQYVSRVRPYLADQWKDRYMKMWEGILDLDAVKPFVYQTGKQKKTNFNRKLVANILHHLDTHHMYRSTYIASQLARALEGDYESSVRGELGKYPSDHMSTAINKFIETLTM